MSRQRVLLLRVERNVARSVIEGAKSSLFFSSGPVAWTVPLEIGPGVTAQIAFRARISGQDDIVMHREVSAWPLSRRASNRAGSLTLLNGDGALNGLLTEEVSNFGVLEPNWRDGRFELRWCWDDEAANPHYTWEQCRIWQAGLIDRLTATANARELILQFADPLAWLDVPLQKNLYPDDFPGSAARGKPKPIALGSVQFAPGVLRSDAITGPEAFAYDFHDGPITSVTTAFDRGDAFNPNTDWSYTADRQGIRLHNAPDNPICANLTGGALVHEKAGLVIGGAFTMIGGVARNRLARLTHTGAMDSPSPNIAGGEVLATAMQPGGSLIITGTFTTVGTFTRNRIARITPAGAVDAGFDPNANNLVAVVALQPDGKILIGGSFGLIGNTPRARVARLNPDGTLDESFGNPGVNGTVTGIAPLPDGKIIITGSILSAGATTRNRIARLNADGSLDAAFDPNANNSIHSLAIQPDGKILVGGDFTVIGNTVRNRIARLNANGTVDMTFNPGANGAVRSITLQPDGNIIITGGFSTVDGRTLSRVARLGANGVADTGFTPQNINGVVYTAALQPDGKILIGGQFTSVGGVTRNRLARLNADGSLDTSFTYQADAVVNTLTIVDYHETTMRLPGFTGWILKRIGAPFGINLDSFHTQSGFDLGAWIDSPITALNLLQQALDARCGWIAARRDGTLFVDNLRSRGTSTGSVRLGPPNIISVSRRDEEAAGLSFRMAGRKNHCVHSDADIATSAPPALRAQLKSEYLTIKTANIDPPACYAHAASAEAKTTLHATESRVQNEINRVAHMFRKQAVWYDVEALLETGIADTIELGDWVHITHPIPELTGGAWLRVMGITLRWHSRTVSLALLQLPE